MADRPGAFISQDRAKAQPFCMHARATLGLQCIVLGMLQYAGSCVSSASQDDLSISREPACLPACLYTGSNLDL